MHRIHEQLAIARKRHGLSFRELLRKSKLKLDKASLIRKLSGAVPMKTAEAEVLAVTMDEQLVWPPRRRRARSA